MLQQTHNYATDAPSPEPCSFKSNLVQGGCNSGLDNGEMPEFLYLFGENI